MKAKHSAEIRRLQGIAYSGLYVNSQRFNNVRLTPAGLEGRDAYSGNWSLLDTEQMTDCNGRKVELKR